MTTSTNTQHPNEPIAKRDLHQHVTNTIIEQLEKGTIPWHQPWSDEQRLPGLPRNAATGKTYRGINVVMLWCAAMGKGYKFQDWATFKQWQEKKATIRKGEKGSLIVYYDTMEKEVDGETKEIPFLKSSYVFNRSQLAGNWKPIRKPDLNEPIAVMESILKVDTFVKNTQVIIDHKGDEACYIPSLDKIWMPSPAQFITTQSCTAVEGYYSTLMHELVHWTGHKTRLDRIKSQKYGDDAYAVEELVAELGNAFLCAEHEINLLPKGSHADYIAHWLEILTDNKYAIFKAAGEATKAVDYLQSLQAKS